MDRMSASLRPLAPAASETEKGGSWVPAVLDVKRRRSNVTVACNECRRRKTRCNGVRPSCFSCQEQSLQCEYRHESVASPASNKLIVEIIGLLNALPAQEASRHLALLSNQTDAMAMLHILKADLAGKHLPADLVVSPALASSSFEKLELETQNPKAYPNLGGLQDATCMDPTQSALQLGMPRPVLHDAGLGMENAQVDPHHAQNLSVLASSEGAAVLPDAPSCDPRLGQLDIGHWTSVGIGNHVAAKCISLYLENDHALLAHFDREMFLSHLIFKQTGLCSSLLVNALLWWTCQVYSDDLPEADCFISKLEYETQRLWYAERSSGRDSMHSIAAAEFLSLGFLAQGRNDQVRLYFSEALQMGTRMRLFCVQDNDTDMELDHVTNSASMCAAWGVFIWIMIMSNFLHQQGTEYPKCPPRIPISEYGSFDHAQVQVGPQGADEHLVPLLPAQEGQAFPFMCGLWRIIRGVNLDLKTSSHPWEEEAPLAFAEYKFRELLTWSNHLPSQFARDDQSPHDVQLLHLWFHASILNLFRPHMKNDSRSRLRTFSSSEGCPAAVCAASIAQLKHLTLCHRLDPTSTYSIMWHITLVHIATSIIDSDVDEPWYTHLVCCIRAYERLSKSQKAAKMTTKALLTIVVGKGNSSGENARRILADLAQDGSPRIMSKTPQRAFMNDAALFLGHSTLTGGEVGVGMFEENALLKTYTNILDDDNG
ncbi:hypothetical protein CDD81_1288 [Ophiocordyceps australis]|uniref:Zn(2)-C6 fungal-type domain-containing protein n=1 Tax=Ophiocordyceps australis TaxID=1399860 RepID=A0A2C5Y039_9HYPO|nr:hypothetical protein CDD81_1288 [Ophiocordyceps australis]